MAVEPFLWGNGGARLTPQQIARERQMAAQMAEGAMDFSPVQHWTQGLGRVAQGLLAGLDYRNADAAATKNEEFNKGLTDKIAAMLMGGGSSSAPAASAALPSSGVASELAITSPSSAPLSAAPPETAALEGYIREAATKRGIDPDVAVRVARSEGLAPGVWQSNVVRKDGQRETSYGPFQLLVGGGLGDKFKELYGKSPSDPSTVYQQVDFALDQAAQGGWSPWYGAAKVGVGSRTGLDNARALGYAPPSTDLPTREVSTPVIASAPTQVAQASPTNSLGISPVILEALTSPYANEQTRGVAQLLLNQQNQRSQSAAEQQQWLARQQYEAQQQANDPLRQLQIQKAQIEVNSATQPKREPLINVGNGTIYDPNAPEDRRFIQAPNSGGQVPDSVRALEIRAERAGLKPGTNEYNQFMLSGGSGGTSLSVGPDGQIQFQQGGAFKPTESQSKDSFFSTRLQSATPTIDKFESALLSLPEAAAGAVPMNLGRYAQSEEYQLAKDAGDDFVAAYLRKDSGAALTKEEKSEYGNLLLPQPGDKAAVVEAKKKRRQVAIAAINSGLPVAAVDNVVRALGSVPGATEPAQTTQEKKTKTGVQWSID